MESRYLEMVLFSLEYVLFSAIVILILLSVKSIFNKKNSGLFLTMTVLIFVSSIRVNTGSDYFNYYSMYNNSTIYYNSFVELLKSGFQKGFMMISYITKSIIENEYAIFIVCALIINVIIFYIISKYSEYPVLSVGIYLFMGYFLMSLNILKQSIAMSIMFAAFFLYREKKYKSFILLVFLAANFHITAIVFALIIILADSIKLKLNLTILYSSVFVGILLIPFSIFIFKMITKISVFSKYAYYMDVGSSLDDYRFIINVMFIIITHTIILHIIIKNVQKNSINISKTEYLIIKMMLVGLMLSIMSVRLFYVNRVSYYTFQFLILLIPMIISKLPNYNLRRKIRKETYILLIAYSFIFTILSGENNYYNYSTIFSDTPVSVMDFVNRGGK